MKKEVRSPESEVRFRVQRRTPPNGWEDCKGFILDRGNAVRILNAYRVVAAIEENDFEYRLVRHEREVVA